MKKHIKILSFVALILALAFCFCACDALNGLLGNIGVDSDAGQLKTPEVTVSSDSSEITWTKISNALQYTVSVTQNGTETTFTTKETTFNFDQNNIGGNFSIRVKAIGDGTVNKSSEWSAYADVAHVHVFSSLENEGSSIKYSYSSKTVTVSFDKVQKATGYVLSVYNGENLITSLTPNNTDYTEKVTFPFSVTSTGTYTVKYVIKGDGQNYQDSAERSFNITVAPFTLVSAAVDYDKKTLKDVVVEYNDTIQNVAGIYFGEEKVNDDLFILDRTAKTITLSHLALDNKENGNNVFTVKTDFNNTDLTVNISDSRTAYTKETAYSVKEYPTEDLAVELYTNGYSVTKVTVGESDVEGFTFDKAQNKLTIPKEFLATLVKDVYTVTVTTQNGSTGFTLNVTAAGAPFLNVSQSNYVKGSNETRSFTCYNLHENDHYQNPILMTNAPDFSVDAYDRDFVPFGTEMTFTFKADYLDTLSAGTYSFLVNNKKSALLYTLTVTDPTLAPYNIRIDFDDEGTGAAYVCWEFDKEDATFTVTVDGAVKQTADTKIAVSALTAKNSFTVTVTENEYSIDNTADLKIPSTVYDAVDYSKKTYTYMGVKHNAYITSVEEAKDLFEYIIFNRANYDVLYPSEYETVVTADLNNSSTQGYERQSFMFIGQQKALDCLGQLKNSISLGYGYLKNHISVSVSAPVDPETGFDYSKPIRSSTQTAVPNTDALPPCYESYVSNRTQSSALPIDSLTKTQTVTTSSQLYYTVENGVRPVCTPGSDAEYIYNKARNVCKTILDDRLNDYQKVHFIYDWLCQNVTYDSALLDMVNHGLSTAKSWEYAGFYLDGVFGCTNDDINSGFAVCDGISKAFVLLTRIEGLESIRVEGTAGGNHAWNKVKIDGRWYACDATWGDTQTNINGAEVAFISHAYLLCSESSLRLKDLDNSKTRTEDETTVLADGEYNDFYDAEGDNIFYVNDKEELKELLNGMTSGDVYELFIGINFTFSTAGTTFSGTSMPRGTNYIVIKR